MERPLFYADADRWSPGENLGNVLSHAVGAAGACWVAAALVSRSVGTEDLVSVFAYGIYGATLVFAFGVSAAYHAVHSAGLRRTLLLLDYVSIYLLIAGTWTPFVLVSVGGSWGYQLFALFWALALIGVASRLLVRQPRPIVGTAVYVLIGWSGVAAIPALRRSLPTDAFTLLLGGGGLITLGALVYLWEKLPYNHLIWHLMVLVGAGIHAWLVWTYV